MNNISGFLVNTYSGFIGSNRLPGIKVSEKPGEARTAIFYINDTHGQLAKMDCIKTASDVFEKSYSNKQGIDTLKLSGGDNVVGPEQPKNNLWFAFLSLIGLDASAVGNHEFDSGEAGFSQELNNVKGFKFVASNITVNPNSPLMNNIKDNKLFNSLIINKNGHNYGLIGTVPTDLMERKSTLPITDVSVNDILTTINNVQKEVDKLKDQGVNKIILLSHLGYLKDKELARRTSGIDVIIGGHSHDYVEGVKNGENLLYSKSGEPVLITQAKKDGEYYGIVDAVFDEQGKIKALSNHLNESMKLPKDPNIVTLKNSYLGIPKNIGIAASDCHPKNTLATENPIANLIADAVRQKSGAQIAIINSGNIRGLVDAGVLTDRDVMELAPFRDNAVKVKLTEKDLIDALNNGAKSTQKAPFKPGLLQVSGLRYKVTPEKTVKDVYLENKDGSLTKLNHENPATTQTFEVAYDKFLLGGPEGFTTLKKPENVIENYNWNKADATVEYVKSFNNKPLELKADNRISVE